MRLGKALFLAASCSCAFAALTAVPTDSDSIVVERPHISPHDVDEVPEWARVDMEILGHDIELVQREIDGAAGVVTEQETVTAAPAGTTTVYVPGSSPTAETENALFAMTQPQNTHEIPSELIMTQPSDDTTVVTTLIQTSVITTVTTVASAPSTPDTTPFAQTSLTTVTDPLNPYVTTVMNLASTSCLNNTSLDTSSYVNISTFSTSGLFSGSSTSSLAFNSTVASLLRSAMGRTGTTKCASKGGHITTAKGKAPTTAPLPSVRATPASSTSTLGSQAGPAITAVGKDGGGVMKVFGTMVVMTRVCFLLAFFL